MAQSHLMLIFERCVLNLHSPPPAVGRETELIVHRFIHWDDEKLFEERKSH